MRKQGIFAGLAALIAMFVAVVPARADFVPVLDLTPPAPSPGTFYYDLNFSTVPDTGNGGVPTERLDTGAMIIIAGTQGLTGESIASAYSSMLSVSASGSTVTVTYTGPSTTTSPTNFTDGLIITLTFTGTTGGGFVGTDIKNSGGDAGTPITTTGSVLVAGASVPEPSSIVLSTIGLVVCGLGVSRRRAAKS